MIDVKGTIQKAKLERARKFISIIDLLDFIKQMDITANFSDIVDFLLIKLKDNNPRTSTQYDHFGNAIYEEIHTYYLPINLEENEKESWVDFFEVLEEVKCNFSKYDLDKWFLDDCDLMNEAQSKNFIKEGGDDLFISRPQIERLLDIKIPIDNKITGKYKQERLFYLTGEITKLDPEYFSTPKRFDIDQQKEECKQLNQTILTQKQHIAELEQQLEELKQKLAQATQPTTVGNSQNYNPTERETHLQMIYGLTCLLSKKEINHQRYIRGNNINKSMIASDLERELQGIFTTPKTAEGFRNRLTDILKEAE